jgi:hypothetical protein
MPPDFTQSVRNTRFDKNRGHNGVNKTAYYYTASCGAKFTSLNAAWHHHDPSGVARRVFDEAKEATKEAAKRVSKEAAWDAAMSSTSIVNDDVICYGRAKFQGTQKYTGASWTHQFGHKTKGIICSTCGKKTVASKWAVVAA